MLTMEGGKSRGKTVRAYQTETGTSENLYKIFVKLIINRMFNILGQLKHYMIIYSIFVIYICTSAYIGTYSY